MISESKTSHALAVRAKPGWVNPSFLSYGELVLFTFLTGFVGCFVGVFIAWIADAIYLGGHGIEEPNVASFGECAPYIFGPGIISALVFYLYYGAIPAYFSKSQYFSNEYHLTAHREYMSLDRTSRANAQDAYDALAAFDNPQRSRYHRYDDDARDSEHDLMLEAVSVWNQTYQKLKDRETASDLELHRERVENAKRALESLS